MPAAFCLLLGLALLLGGAVSAAPPAKKKSTPSAKAASTSAGARKAGSASTRNSSAARKRSSRKSQMARSRRPAQSAPAPERYKQIQQALAEKGYLSGDASGRWGAESVEALKRFQEDQNLEPTGKINSLSLIALGLGPEHSRPGPKPEESR